jgi:hypothetical protein
MNSINLNITSNEVKSKTKKLRARWSYEIICDLNDKNGLYGIDEETARELAISVRREMRLKSIKNIFSLQKP